MFICKKLVFILLAAGLFIPASALSLWAQDYPHPSTYVPSPAQIAAHKDVIDDPRPILKTFGIRQLVPKEMLEKMKWDVEEMKQQWSEIRGFKAPDVVGKIAPDIRPGKYTFEDVKNNPGFKELLPDGYIERFKKTGPPLAGTFEEFEIIPTRQYYMPLPVAEATAKNAGKTKLDDQGYVIDETWESGVPFPRPDGKFKAQQIMYNLIFSYKGWGGNIYFVDNAVGWNRNLDLDFSNKLHYYGVRMNGRVIFPPLGAINERAAKRRELKGDITIYDAPRDVAGMTMVNISFIPAESEDQCMMYLPSLGRVRKLSASDTQDPMAGFSQAVDDLGGFAQTMSPDEYPMTYEVIAEREFLVTAPTTDGAFTITPKGTIVGQQFERRPVWVVQLTELDPNYVYSKRILYVDQETYRIIFSDMYDQKGRKYRTTENGSSWHPDFGVVSAGGGWVGIIAPLTMLVICTIMGLGFTGWIQMNFSPLLYVLAFLVGARLLSNSVQITHRYIEELRATGRVDQATGNTITAMWKPNAAAVMTDAAGFLVLGLAKIVLLQQLAVIMSFWMLTIGLSGILVPIICSMAPVNPDTLKTASSQTKGDNRLDRMISKTVIFSLGPGRPLIFIIIAAILGIGIWQIRHLEVGDPTPGSAILWPDQQYNTDTALLNEKFKASSDDFSLFFEGKKGAVYQPEVLKTLEDFSDYMLETLPDIYKSSDSILNLVRSVNYMFREGDPLRYQLPASLEEMTGLLGQLKSTIDPAVLALYMDKEMQRTQITLYFADHTSKNIARIKTAAYDFFKNRGLALENGGFNTEYGTYFLAGGAIGMEIALNEEMRRSHAVMDALVLLAIFVMCSLTFRSMAAGLMLAVPLLLSNLIAFTYMTWANVGLTTNTLPCSAVGVGVGVDFAIYLYSRCMEGFSPEKTFRDVVIESAGTAGKGILFTGITLILPLIMWYAVSGLKFQAQMGFFLSMLLFTNMVAALTLHPLLICTIRPKFLKRKADQNLQPKLSGFQASGTEHS